MEEKKTTAAKSRRASEPYYRDQLVQIKPYKGRGKYELYVHQATFRSQALTWNLLFPAEGLEGQRAFAKKMFFVTPAYGQLLAGLCALLASSLRRHEQAASVQAFIDELVASVREEFKLSLTHRDDDEQNERLVKAYLRAAQLLRETAEQSR